MTIEERQEERTSTTNREAVLLDRWARGDADALNKLMSEHIPGIERLALKLTKDPSLADDVVSEALLRVFRAASKFRGGAQFKTWLHRIVVNCVLDIRRKKTFFTTSLDEIYSEEDGSKVQMQLADDKPDPLQALIENEELDSIERSMNTLQGDQRSLILLFHQSELGYHEIADSLHIPIGTVKSRLHRARVSVRDEVRRDHRRFGGGSKANNHCLKAS